MSALNGSAGAVWGQGYDTYDAFRDTWSPLYGNQMFSLSVLYLAPTELVISL